MAAVTKTSKFGFWPLNQPPSLHVGHPCRVRRNESSMSTTCSNRYEFMSKRVKTHTNRSTPCAMSKSYSGLDNHREAYNHTITAMTHSCSLSKQTSDTPFQHQIHVSANGEKTKYTCQIAVLQDKHMSTTTVVIEKA